MTKTSAEYVRAHRMRKRQETMLDDLDAATQERLAADMKWTIIPSENGHRIEWDMSKETDALLRAHAESKGADFDELMDGLNRALLRKALAAIAAKNSQN